MSSHFLLVSAGRWAKHSLCGPQIQHSQGDSMGWTAVGVSTLTWPSRLFPPARAAPGPRARPSSEWFPVRHGHPHFVSGCWGTPRRRPKQGSLLGPLILCDSFFAHWNTGVICYPWGLTCMIPACTLACGLQGKTSLPLSVFFE